MTLIHQIAFDPSNQSAFGTLETAELTPVFQGDFVYGLNNQIWETHYYFTVTSPASPPAVGDIYTNNNGNFAIDYSSGSVLICDGTSDPAASGNLARDYGSRTNPIVFSAFSSKVGFTFGTGASVDTDSSRLRIQSGTSSTSLAYIQSRRPIRYRAGQGQVIRMTPIFGTGVVNNTQSWGVGFVSGSAIYDGYFFENSGSSFGIGHYIRGVANRTVQSAWNGDKCDGSSGTSFTYDPTKGTPVMIKYPYLGFGDIEFFMENPSNGRWVLVHTIQYANTVNTTQVSNPTLFLIGFNSNYGNTINKIMYCGSVGAFISGERSFTSNPKWAIDSTKTNPTTETSIVTLKNCSLYNGVVNRGMMRLHSITVALSGPGNQYGIVRLKIGSVIGGSPSFTPINGTATDTGVASVLTSANSIVAYDTAGTTVTGGNLIFNTTIGTTGQVFCDLFPYEFFVAPLEILTISGFVSANAVLTVTINWSEDI